MDVLDRSTHVLKNQALIVTNSDGGTREYIFSQYEGIFGLWLRTAFWGKYVSYVEGCPVTQIDESETQLLQHSDTRIMYAMVRPILAGYAPDMLQGDFSQPSVVHRIYGHLFFNVLSHKRYFSLLL